MFLFATLSLFLTYGVTIVWVANYVMEMPMSSWRAGWESGYSFPEALGVSIQFLTFFSILSNVAISYLPAYRIGPFNPLGNGYHMPVLFLTGLSGLALIGDSRYTSPRRVPDKRQILSQCFSYRRHLLCLPRSLHSIYFLYLVGLIGM